MKSYPRFYSIWLDIAQLIERAFSLPLGAGIRILPYCMLVILTGIQGLAHGSWPFIVYFAKIIIGGWIVISLWKQIYEWRITLSIEAVAVGIMVWGIWVFTEPFYPKLQAIGSEWNPWRIWGENSLIGWFFIIVRALGSSLVIPPAEEVFFRSFLYRWFQNNEIMQIPLNKWNWKGAFLTAIIFGAVHREWLAAIICSLAYQWLTYRKGDLSYSIIAHGITNLLLAIWISLKGEWHFW